MNESLPDGVTPEREVAQPPAEDIIVAELAAGDTGDLAPAPAPAPVDCWRCGKPFDAAQPFCPYCRARRPNDLALPARQQARITGDAPTPDVVRLIWVFAGLLVTSVIYGCFIHFGLSKDHFADDHSEQVRVIRLLVIELVDVALVLGALFWVGRPLASVRRSIETRILIWTSAFPALVLLLGLNWGYHQLLRDFLAAPVWWESVVVKDKLTMWNVVLVCVQPALVEELFFRYLALGTLRRYMGVNAAVLVSSVMFGMAHIGAPLSIPMLTVIGVALGYLRVGSGGLALPILVHFCHNAAILAAETLL